MTTTEWIQIGGFSVMVLSIAATFGGLREQIKNNLKSQDERHQENVKRFEKQDKTLEKQNESLAEIKGALGTMNGTLGRHDERIKYLEHRRDP